jgi:hypothetical protein
MLLELFDRSRGQTAAKIIGERLVAQAIGACLHASIKRPTWRPRQARQRVAASVIERIARSEC